MCNIQGINNFDDIVKLNDIAREKTNNKIRIRKYVESHDVYGGYEVEYDSYARRRIENAPLGDIVSCVKYKEYYIDNVYALSNIFNKEFDGLDPAKEIIDKYINYIQYGFDPSLKELYIKEYKKALDICNKLNFKIINSSFNSLSTQMFFVERTDGTRYWYILKQLQELLTNQNK